jgi:biopolymer transport protein TolR
MAFSMAGGGPSGPQINVTPLIDVLLTLIVVFMIVVAMEQDKGERVQIPQPQTQQTPEQKQSRTIVIQLVWTAKDQPPELKINGEPVKRDDLEARLAEIFLKRAEKVAFVRGDDDVDFQDVADVIDVARHAGVQRIGLLTKEREWVGELNPTHFGNRETKSGI